jgi:Tol biopolymer transport system component
MTPRLAWMIAAVFLLVAAAAVATRESAATAPLTRVEIVTPQTTDPDSFAISPDGRQLVFAASNEQSAITPDGRQLVFSEQFPNTGEDIMAVKVDGQHQVTPLVQTPNDERNGIVSPDGRWLAYEANDTGAFEIYVRPYRNVNSGRWQASTGVGTQPLWAHSGRELFYLASADVLMHVAVGSGPTWTATTPMKLLEGRTWASFPDSFSLTYDIAPDDQRFLMIKAGGSDATGAASHFEVVQHFDEALRRLVPPK